MKIVAALLLSVGFVFSSAAFTSVPDTLGPGATLVKHQGKHKGHHHKHGKHGGKHHSNA